MRRLIAAAQRPMFFSGKRVASFRSVAVSQEVLPGDAGAGHGPADAQQTTRRLHAGQRALREPGSPSMSTKKVSVWAQKARVVVRSGVLGMAGVPCTPSELVAWVRNSSGAVAARIAGSASSRTSVGSATSTTQAMTRGGIVLHCVPVVSREPPPFTR